MAIQQSQKILGAPIEPDEQGDPITTLVGTEWKLTAFVELENNRSRKSISPFTNPEIYTLYFDSSMIDDIIPQSVRSIPVTEVAYYDYNANYIDSTIVFKAGLFSGHWSPNRYDDDNFSYAILNSTKFDANSNQLKLFYNDRKNYLLFNRR